MHGKVLEKRVLKKKKRVKKFNIKRGRYFSLVDDDPMNSSELDKPE